MKRAILFRVGAIVLLLIIAGIMMVIGRGHTVYIDSVAFEENGKTYTAPYKVAINVNGEQVAKLYDGERGMATWIGQSFEMTLEITQEKGDDEKTSTVKLDLPYGMDGVAINLPALLAGLPAEAYLSEFQIVPEVVEDSDDAAADDGAAIGGDIMGDDTMGGDVMGGDI